MNSPMQRPREMIRFEHPHEWQGREGFRPSLTLVEADVSHFVGGYNLPKDLYQHCGLAHGGKPCNQEHGHGFVVAGKDGQETQVGRDCGLRHLGAKFEELERLFTATVRTAELQKRMNDLVDKKAELLAKATAAIGECDRAAASVGEIKHRIEREPSLAEVFHRAQGAEGSVYAEVRVSSEEYELTRKRFRREVWGRIDGIAAATEKTPKIAIHAVVMPFVHGLTKESLAGLGAKALAAKSKEAGEAERVLVQAEAYVALCKRFVSVKNWKALALALAFEPNRLPTNDRRRRILSQLCEGTS